MRNPECSGWRKFGVSIKTRIGGGGGRGGGDGDDDDGSRGVERSRANE